jgi:glycosyltransferase involved in cell wall biosynthesis
MTSANPHITVCVCTYKRVDYLRRLLDELRRQDTGGRFSYSVVVADNDALQSARSVAEAFGAAGPPPVHYCFEPRQNIALARNKAVEHATGEFVAFIDDDEVPVKRWLLTLLEACQRYDAAGALGPVKPRYDAEPPRWVVKGRFYDRATYPTGLRIDWKKGRTGNVLLKRTLFAEDGPPFRPEFLSGEDQDFFRRMIERGHVFVWCDEALAYESVPPIRWKRSFMLRRALLRGAVSRLDPTLQPLDVAKSLVAVPAYGLALPFALVAGQHRFMSCLVRLCDHLGRVLALAGIRPVKEPYVTE